MRRAARLFLLPLSFRALILELVRTEQLGLPDAQGVFQPHGPRVQLDLSPPAIARKPAGPILCL